MVRASLKKFFKKCRSYIALLVLRSSRGQHSTLYERSLKRILVYHYLKRELRRFRHAREIAKVARPRQWHVRPIFQDRHTHGAWYSLFPTMMNEDPDSFFNFCRMTPDCFRWLEEKLHPYLLKKSYRENICPGERLAVTLRYLASGDSMASLSYLFRISDECISNIALETSYYIWLVLKDIVFEVLSPDFWRKKAAEFDSMWNFPMCVGAIDGKHCFVQKFPMRGSENYCYKDEHSVVLFAVSDAKYKFIAVDVGARGRESDGGVFSRSQFGQLFEDHQLNLPPPVHSEVLNTSLPFVFVGDDAFPLHTHLMKPFDGYVANKDVELVFNYRLSRARRVVENAFGILSARFQILRRKIIGSETLVVNCILATTALHNLHLKREDSIPPKQRIYVPPGYADMYRSNGKVKRGRWRNELKLSEQSIFKKLKKQALDCGEPGIGITVRERFVSLFLSRPVEWQWDVMPNI